MKPIYYLSIALVVVIGILGACIASLLLKLDKTNEQLTNANQLIEECIDYIDTTEGNGVFMDTVGSGDAYYFYSEYNK